MVATERIRNVVLVGHNGSGKTTLAEVLLYRAGVIARPGSTERIAST
jgi:elongation factor G